METYLQLCIHKFPIQLLYINTYSSNSIVIITNLKHRCHLIEPHAAMDGVSGGTKK